MSSTSSAKQLLFWKSLMAGAGQPPSEDEMASFAKLSGKDASDAISSLLQRRETQPANAAPADVSQEPE